MKGTQMKHTLEKLEKKLSLAYNNERHLTDAANGVFMAALRNDVDLETLFNDIELGSAFATEDFFAATSGNLLDFLKPEYHSIAQSLVNITAGGNGGMASIGRGEFFIAFMSNFEAMICKSGNGDIEWKGIFEEVKHNGGKIKVDDKTGREVTRKFLDLVKDSSVQLKDSDYLPGRKKDLKLYDNNEVSVLNSLFWTATTGEQASEMSYEQWALACIDRAGRKVFDSSNTLLVIDQDNNFVRFFCADDVVEYYSPHVKKVKFELRSWQNNPVAIYAKLL